MHVVALFSFAAFLFAAPSTASPVSGDALVQVTGVERLPCPRPGALGLAIERRCKSVLAKHPGHSATHRVEIEADSRRIPRILIRMFDDSGTLLFDDALPISRADCPILPDALATLLRSWLLRETHRLEPTPPPSDTPTAPAARADEPDSASSSESTAGAPAPPESTSAASENRAAPWREDVKGPARRLSLLIGAATDCHRFGPAAQLAFDTDLTSRLGITVQGRYEAPVGAYTTWSLGPMLRATFLAAEPFVLELLGGPVLVAHLAAPPRPDTYRWSLEMTARVRLRLGAGFQAIGGLTVAADPHPTLGRPRWLPLVGVAREIGS